MQEDSKSKSARASGSSEQELECQNATRGVWLVKIPKYLSEKWEKSQSNSEVGRLRIAKGPGGKSLINFKLNDAFIDKSDEGVTKIPKDYRFEVNSIGPQTLGVFSENVESNKLLMEGKVMHKAECRAAPGDVGYLELKKEAIRKASQPVRVVQQLDRVVNTFKPISDHKHNIEYEKSKKEQGKKLRGDKEKVMEMLFNAFEKHQFYNLRDLVNLTNQPVTYLKEILKEICTYNLKNPNKNTWELKPEYRHYNMPSESAAMDTTV